MSLNHKHGRVVPLDLDGMVADHLNKNEVFRREYLQDLLNEPDVKMVAASLKPLVLALGGVAKLSKESGLSRQSLYKALSGKVEPEYSTLVKIVRFAGYDLGFVIHKRTVLKRTLTHA